MRQRAWRELKPFVGLAAVIAVYAIVRAIYLAASGDQGVLVPSGAIDRKLAVLAFATFVLRMCVLVGVPFIAVYRLVMRALQRWTTTR